MKKYQYIIYRLLIGGSNNSLSKIVVNELSVSLFLVFRQLLSILILFLDFIRKKESIKDIIPRNKTKEIKLDILKLFFIRAIAVFTFYYALSKLPVSFVSISEASLSIVFTMLVSVFLLKEKYQLNKYFYILLLITGIICSSQIETVPISITLWIALLLNGLGIALDAYYNKKLTSELTTNQLVFIKTFCVIPVAICMYFILPNQSFDSNFFKTITFIYIVCFLLSACASYFSNFFIIRSIQEIGPTKTNIITSTMPMVSILFAFIIFQERFTMIQGIGFIFVIIGIIGFNLNKSKR